MAKVYGDEPGAFSEFKKLKDEPLKVKLEYLAQYYGAVTLVVMFVIIAAISLTRTIIVNSRPRVIQGLCLMGDYKEGTDTELKAYLCEELQLDPAKYELDYSSNYYDPADAQTAMTTIQTLQARIIAKDVDFLIGFQSVFNTIMSKTDPDACGFTDLSEFLTEEEIRILTEQGRLIYFEADWGTIPYLIKLDDTPLYDRLGVQYSGGYFGVFVNTDAQEAIRILMRDLF